jgi:hypothetical protein
MEAYHNVMEALKQQGVELDDQQVTAVAAIRRSNEMGFGSKPRTAGNLLRRFKNAEESATAKAPPRSPAQEGPGQS